MFLIRTAHKTRDSHGDLEDGNETAANFSSNMLSSICRLSSLAARPATAPPSLGSSWSVSASWARWVCLALWWGLTWHEFLSRGLSSWTPAHGIQTAFPSLLYLYCPFLTAGPLSLNPQHHILKAPAWGGLPTQLPHCVSPVPTHAHTHACACTQFHFSDWILTDTIN